MGNKGREIATVVAGLLSVPFFDVPGEPGPPGTTLTKRQLKRRKVRRKMARKSRRINRRKRKG